MSSNHDINNISLRKQIRQSIADSPDSTQPKPLNFRKTNPKNQLEYSPITFNAIVSIDENAKEEDAQPFESADNPNCTYFDLPWNRARTDPSIIKPNTEIKLSPVYEGSSVADWYEIFKEFGDIIHIELSEKTRTAFIRYADPRSVSTCLGIRHIKINSKIAKISSSSDNVSIFIGNLNKNWKVDYIESQWNPVFTGIKFKVRCLPGQFSEANRGFGFIEFDNAINARTGYERLSKTVVIGSRALTIDWAKGLDSTEDINLTQLHVSGIRDDNTTKDWYDIFSKYGSITSIKWSRDFVAKKTPATTTASSPTQAKTRQRKRSTSSRPSRISATRSPFNTRKSWRVSTNTGTRWKWIDSRRSGSGIRDRNT